MARGVGSVGPAGPGGKLLLSALLRASPWVMFWSLLGATAGSAGFAAVHQLGTAVTMAAERVLADGALPSLSVTRHGGIDARKPRELEGQPGVRTALARQTGRVHLLAGDRECAAVLFGVQLLQEAMARPQRMQLQFRSAQPGPDQEGDLFLTRATAVELGLEPGAKVAVRGSGATLQLHLRGLLADPAGAVLGGDLAVTGLPTSIRLLGRSELDQLEVVLAGDQDPERATAPVGAMLGAEYTVVPLPTRAAGSAGIAAVRVTVELAAWLALALAAIALAAAAGDRVRAMAGDLALQRAIGAPPALVWLQVLAPSVLAGAVAGFAGTLLGPHLAQGFVPGLQAFLQAQTGAGVSIELPPTGWLGWSPCAGAGAGLLAALWAGQRQARGDTGPGIRAPAGSAARAALGGRRAAVGAACLLAVWLLAWSGATRLGFAVRALDAALAVLGMALLAGPVAALLARHFTALGPIALLAGGRIRRTPGRALSALQLFAAAGAVGLALLGVRSSVAAAAGDIAQSRCSADLVVVRTSALLGLPAAPIPIAAATSALLGTEGLAGPPQAGPDGTLLLHRVAGVDPSALATAAARQLGPLGDVAVVDGAHLRRRFLGAVQLVLEAMAMLVLLLLGIALPAGTAFLCADAAGRRHEGLALTAAGAGPGQRAAITIATALLLTATAAVLSLLGGTLIGACWTAGPLQHALGVRCPYAVPVAAMATATGLMLLASLLAVALAMVAGPGRRAHVTAW